MTHTVVGHPHPHIHDDIRDIPELSLSRSARDMKRHRPRLGWLAGSAVQAACAAVRSVNSIHERRAGTLGDRRAPARAQDPQRRCGTLADYACGLVTVVW